MPGAAAQIPASPWISGETLRFSGDSESLGDVFFGFLGEGSTGSSWESGEWIDGEDCGDGEEGRKQFWEEQDQLLQVIRINFRTVNNP